MTSIGKKPMCTEAKLARIFELRVIDTHAARAAEFAIEQMIIAIDQHDNFQLIRRPDHFFKTSCRYIQRSDLPKMGAPSVNYVANRLRALIAPMRIGGAVV